jgi:hypothetical protein
VCVSVGRVFSGTPGAERGAPFPRGLAVRSADLTVWIIREVPTMDDDGNPPEAEEIDRSAARILTDAWVLYGGLQDGWGRSEILGRCEQASFGPAVILGPEGGFGGVSLSIQVGLT